MTFTVYDPRGTPNRSAFTQAAYPRKERLTIGVLDNSKEQADVLLGRAAELLQADGMTPVFARKPSFSRTAPTEVVEALKMCDLVITGLGG
jgi:hypothetical protein